MKKIVRTLNTPMFAAGIAPALIAWGVTLASVLRFYAG